jgi:glycosyltransferase involved in cell wall biosynthesis
VSGLGPPGDALVLVGEGEGDSLPPGAHAAGRQDPVALRNFYAGSDVLVMSAIAARETREPWGLVANEAMHQQLPVIATDAVGAAAGGLVRHERNGLVVPAGDPVALAGALRTLRDDPALRQRLGAAAAQDAAAHTFAAWASGVAGALSSVGAGQEGDR